MSFSKHSAVTLAHWSAQAPQQDGAAAVWCAAAVWAACGQVLRIQQDSDASSAGGALPGLCLALLQLRPGHSHDPL